MSITTAHTISTGTASQRCPSDEEAEHGRRRPALPSILLQTGRKMLLCCCWPLNKCVQVLSLLDTTLVIIGAYKSWNLLENSWPEVPWIVWLQFFFFVSFSVAQIVATVLVVLGQKRQLAHYLWPRLTLLVGLFLCTLIVIGIMFLYFSGWGTSMNEAFFSIYEWFFAEKLDEAERRELKNELKIYGYCFFALAVLFCTYTFVELALTKKYYDSLKTFEPVSTVEPTAPQQAPYNPDYQAQKMYPNLA